MPRTASRVALAALLLALLPTALAQDAHPGVACPPGETCSEKAAGGVRAGPCPTDVNCTGGTKPGSGTCMDGQQGNETCDPDVRYLGGPSPQAESAKSVPAGGVLVVFAAFALAVAAVATLRRR